MEILNEFGAGDLLGANLRFANLRGADLSRAIIHNVISDSDTIKDIQQLAKDILSSYYGSFFLSKIHDKSELDDKATSVLSEKLPRDIIDIIDRHMNVLTKNILMKDVSWAEKVCGIISNSKDSYREVSFVSKLEASKKSEEQSSDVSIKLQRTDGHNR